MGIEVGQYVKIKPGGEAKYLREAVGKYVNIHDIIFLTKHVRHAGDPWIVCEAINSKFASPHYQYTDAANICTLPNHVWIQKDDLMLSDSLGEVSYEFTAVALKIKELEQRHKEYLNEKSMCS